MKNNYFSPNKKQLVQKENVYIFLQFLLMSD